MNKRQVKKLEDKKAIELLNSTVSANKNSIANIIEAQAYMQIENDKKYSDLKEMHKSLADLLEKTVDHDYKVHKALINDLTLLEYKVFLLNVFVVVLAVLLVITWLV